MKDERINIRLSKKEKDYLESKANQSGMSLSQYIISSALNKNNDQSIDINSVAMCSKDIMNFFYAAENYVLNCSDDIELVRRLYLTTIKHNPLEAGIFVSTLPKIREQLKQDLTFFMECDPAADSEEEVVLAYPGYKAIRYYRIAHELYNLGERMYARIISENAHVNTGVDIHPGAKIGCPLFIDHGTGIVIGETTIIGERVRMYQSVTLGALSLAKGSKIKGVKRHPTIGDDVTLYAGVSILGGDVVIGNRVTVGSNVFLTESIPDDMRVINNKPELVLQKRK